MGPIFTNIQAMQTLVESNTFGNDKNKGALQECEAKNESWGSSVTTGYKLSNPLGPSRFIRSLKCGGTME
jgi:hypothetical protein